MPLIKSAIKKVRKDKKRTVQNSVYLKLYKQAIQKLKKGTGDTKKLLNSAYSSIDKAVKRKTIHKNKGNRLKSRITKFTKKLVKSQPSSRRKTSK